MQSRVKGAEIIVSQPSKLDLGSLKSYSPTWPFPVRLTLAISVQYACFRLVQRAEAVHRLLTSNTYKLVNVEEEEDDGLVERDEDGNVKSRLEGYERNRQVRKDNDLVAAWKEYTAKFLTATCQHLGIPEETLPRESI